MTHNSAPALVEKIKSMSSDSRRASETPLFPLSLSSSPLSLLLCSSLLPLSPWLPPHHNKPRWDYLAGALFPKQLWMEALKPSRSSESPCACWFKQAVYHYPRCFRRALQSQSLCDHWNKHPLLQASVLLNWTSQGLRRRNEFPNLRTRGFECG